MRRFRRSICRLWSKAAICCEVDRTVAILCSAVAMQTASNVSRDCATIAITSCVRTVNSVCANGLGVGLNHKIAAPVHCSKMGIIFWQLMNVWRLRRVHVRGGE